MIVRKKEPIRISTTITPEIDKNMRNHCHQLRLFTNEVLEIYQTSFLRELESNKTNNSKVTCQKCGVKNYACCMWQEPKEKATYYCYLCKRTLE